MSLPLRILLIVGALLTLLFFLLQIRRRRLQIDYAIFWILVSVLLLIAAVAPGLVMTLSVALGFESTANFVFLVVIFVLLLKMFSVTLRLSKANQQITDLAQRLALLGKAVQEKDGEETVEAGRDNRPL
ncbi:MAG: DUF2304 domain-containing protein [Coriobacteriales bacterium]|jgi:hypothetical protein|nr:DUF2304 domain-containing protein [Coriobacteriales bacterium]